MQKIKKSLDVMHLKQREKKEKKGTNKNMKTMMTIENVFLMT